MDKFKELRNPVTVDFLPKEVKFPKYVLQNTLGKAEAEEMAARFLEFWQEEDQWKAVSMKAVAERMDEQSQDLKKINSEVFTLIIMDAYRIDNGPTFAEIGVRYLVGNKFIDVQRYEEEGEVQIYIAPTDKLLNAIKSFVRKGSTSSFLQVLVSSTFTKLQNISHRKQNKNNKNNKNKS